MSVGGRASHKLGNLERAVAPEKKLAEKKKPNTGEQGRITQPVTPIARSAKLQPTPAKSHEEDAHHHFNQAYQGFKCWLRIFFKDLRLQLYRARFVIEVLGLVGLGYYANQARIGNSLTREIVRSTISASVFCAPSKSYSHMGSREVPMTGAFYVTCNNSGKVAAEQVSGTLKVTAQMFPE